MRHNKQSFMMNEIQKEGLTAYILLVPTIVSFFIFLYIPFFNAIKIGFYKYNVLGGYGDFIGLRNYIRVLGDKLFFSSVWNTFLLMMAGIIIAIPIGFILAYILNTNLPGKKGILLSLFIPYLISMVVVGIIWRMIYDPVTGPLNQILKAIGLNNFALAWLSRKDTALVAISLTWIWRSVPFNMLIIYANILKMPSEMIEAADIDGTNTFQKLRYIIVPYLSSTFSILIMFSVTNAFRLFDLVWIMTQGGPGGASEVMTSYVYRKSFVVQDFGTGTAASLILMIIMITIIGGFYFIKGVLNRRGGLAHEQITL